MESGASELGIGVESGAKEEVVMEVASETGMVVEGGAVREAA